MAKISNNPVETMRLDIEFADNGIILRNPDIEDDVTLALTGPETNITTGFGHKTDHSEEYIAIGKKIYDWLTDVAVPEHADHWVSTGAAFHITAKMKGRPH